MRCTMLKEFHITVFNEGSLVWPPLLPLLLPLLLPSRDFCLHNNTSNGSDSIFFHNQRCCDCYTHLHQCCTLHVVSCCCSLIAVSMLRISEQIWTLLVASRSCESIHYRDTRLEQMLLEEYNIKYGQYKRWTCAQRPRPLLSEGQSRSVFAVFVFWNWMWPLRGAFTILLSNTT